MTLTKAIEPQGQRLPVKAFPRKFYRSPVTVLFAATAFSGAALLFIVQPLVARLLLPWYGGSATVWSTSSLFFQAALLFAYWYVHWSTNRFGNRWQPRTQVLLLVIPLFVLPLTLPTDAAPPAETSPVLWLLRALLLLVGLPFCVLATTGPLLQRWYSWSRNDGAEDPYFLYAASNLGSFVGLLSYPFLVEPRMSLTDQRLLWSWGFVAFVALATACAVIASRRSISSRAATSGELTSLPPLPTRLSRQRLLRWAGLAFLPSALMLAVTSHLSTDVASIPLLWTVPLAIYLATYVIAFGRTTRTTSVLVTRAAVVPTCVALLVSQLQIPLAVAAALDLVMLGLVAYACHAMLAADRPTPEHLTLFYLIIAAGGALGGLLNGVIGPLVFDRVLEYPLLLVAGPLLLFGITWSDDSFVGRAVRANRVRAVLVLTAVALLMLLLFLTAVIASGAGLIRFAVLIAALLAAGALAWKLSRSPAVLMFGMVVLLIVSTLAASSSTVHRVRTFYGSYKIQASEDVHQLVHGTTIHGTQFRDARMRNTPTTYYARQGPLGDLFEQLDRGRFDRVGAVGLGTGTIAAYGRPDQVITFFEIDEAMIRTAYDSSLFSYLRDSEAEIETVVGDGRLKLAEQPPGAFDLLILDAFSSDSIPVHLLTTEAMHLYADRLAPGGVLAVHISNRVFDLEPVVAGGVQALGWQAAVQHFPGGGEGSTASSWVVASADTANIDLLLQLEDWRSTGDHTETWTDDYSSVLTALR